MQRDDGHLASVSNILKSLLKQSSGKGLMIPNRNDVGYLEDEQSTNFRNNTELINIVEGGPEEEAGSSRMRENQQKYQKYLNNTVKCMYRIH